MTNYYADQDPKSHMISSSEIKNKYATRSNPTIPCLYICVHNYFLHQKQENPHRKKAR